MTSLAMADILKSVKSKVEELQSIKLELTEKINEFNSSNPDQVY